ncbi:sulfurtransferase [Arenimonas sp. MALMAid1274]|uniref:sulfurtransferase n=1 Tax=Arenimonas sp. MALMAid1274 TaxID=3411630 RepID=UPI003B9F0F46
MNWTTLVTAADLAASLGAADLVVVDCRHVLADADAGEQTWRAGHLPGAGHVHLDRDLSDHRKPAAQGRHPLPDAADFTAVLRRLGIGPGTQVVAYDAGEGAMAAARFWWLLRLLGHARVAVLDGGLAAWTARGLPLETAIPAHEPGDYAGQFDLAQVADVQEVMSRLHEAPGWLLDARAPERFRGEVEPLDPVAGHVPGARNRPYAYNLVQGVFKPAGKLREEFLALIGSRDPAEVVLGCGSGVTACHNLLAMEHAGLHGARIYAGSWSGWVSDRARPVATGAAS